MYGSRGRKSRDGRDKKGGVLMTARNDMINKGRCPDCESVLAPLPSGNNIEASEWYCSNCHESFRMSREDAMHFLGVEAKRKQ